MLTKEQIRIIIDIENNLDIIREAEHTIRKQKPVIKEAKERIRYSKTQFELFGE